jgi:hypothetical protein
VLAGQNVAHHKPAKDCRFSESSPWGSELDSNCRDGYSLPTLNQKQRVDLMAQRTHAPLSPQGGMSVSSSGWGGQGGMLHRCAIVPDRFGGVGAWHACRNSAVFCWSAWSAAEIAAAQMLVFFRKSAALDILTKRDNTLRITLSETDIRTAEGMKCQRRYAITWSISRRMPIFSPTA